MICGAVSPDGNATCQMPEGQHAWHTGIVPGSVPPTGVDWANEDYIAPLKASTRASREVQKARLRAAVKGPTSTEVTRATWAQTKEVWLHDARTTMHTYCRTHPAPFTTPEHIWPLLDAPAEMRGFVVVVQHALRRRWIKEVGSKRLRDVYVTRDGRQFQMNKLVPVYQSLIVLHEEV